MLQGDPDLLPANGEVALALGQGRAWARLLEDDCVPSRVSMAGLCAGAHVVLTPPYSEEDPVSVGPMAQ